MHAIVHRFAVGHSFVASAHSLRYIHQLESELEKLRLGHVFKQDAIEEADAEGPAQVSQSVDDAFLGKSTMAVVASESSELKPIGKEYNCPPPRGLRRLACNRA
jgi:hypothetical protein